MLLLHCLDDDESLEAMVHMRAWEVLFEALKVHTWEHSVMEAMARVVFFLGAHPDFDATQAAALIDITLWILETHPPHILALYRTISHFVKDQAAAYTFKGNLDRFANVISKRMPVITDQAEVNEIAHVMFAVARSRTIYLSEGVHFVIMDAFKPFLRHPDNIYRLNVTLVYAEFFHDIRTIEAAGDFLQRGFVEPLMKSLAVEEDAMIIPYACVAVATALGAIGPKDWGTILAMPCLVKVIAQMLISPMSTPIFPAAIQITYAVLRDCPRVNRRYLDFTALDATSTNPLVDYLYAAVGEKILQMQVSDPTHSSLLLLPIFEELVGMPVPNQGH